MSGDARFADGDETPLALVAQSAEDVSVLSALIQDAVLPLSEMRYDAKRRAFSALINRFRWENGARAHPPERVQSLLVIEDALKVASQGIDRSDRDLVVCVLALNWQAGADGTGRLEVILAGDGAIALEVEALSIRLRDVTRPYIAPSRQVPRHEI